MYIYVPSWRSPLDHVKLIILIILWAFWVYQGYLDMLSTIVSNSHFGKRPIAREMTTFVSNVGVHVSESVNSY